MASLTKAECCKTNATAHPQDGKNNKAKANTGEKAPTARGYQRISQADVKEGLNRILMLDPFCWASPLVDRYICVRRCITANGKKTKSREAEAVWTMFSVRTRLPMLLAVQTSASD